MCWWFLWILTICTVKYWKHAHTLQFKITTVQVKTNTVQDMPKWNRHNIIKYPLYKFNDTFINKNFTLSHFNTLTHFFTSLLTSLYSLSMTIVPTPCISWLSSQLTVDSDMSSLSSSLSSSSSGWLWFFPWRCPSRALYSCTLLPQL